MLLLHDVDFDLQPQVPCENGRWYKTKVSIRSKSLSDGVAAGSCKTCGHFRGLQRLTIPLESGSSNIKNAKFYCMLVVMSKEMGGCLANNKNI